jgi:hypothetical protein
VHGVDAVLPEKLHQSAHTFGVDRATDSKYLGRYAGTTKKVAKPSYSIRRTNGHNRVAAAPELLRQTEDHHLRAAGSV